jgi:hypothetical protein
VTARLLLAMMLMEMKVLMTGVVMVQMLALLVMKMMMVCVLVAAAQAGRVHQVMFGSSLLVACFSPGARGYNARSATHLLHGEEKAALPYLDCITIDRTALVLHTPCK